MNSTLNRIALASLMRSDWMLACLDAMDAGLEISMFEGFRGGN